MPNSIKRIATLKINFDTPNAMKELLENEGIEFDDDQILDFEKHFWDPGKELEFINGH